MGDKIEIDYDRLLQPVLEAMTRYGLLLVTKSESGKPNIMTIGWGAIGSIWARPTFVVLVRPSRYTYRLIKEGGDFTVNMLPSEMGDVVSYCGSVSGRDHDKFQEKNLTAVPGLKSNAPIIGESLVSYECRTVLTSEMDSDCLPKSIRDSAYQKGDFHTIFFGEILCVQSERTWLSPSHKAQLCMKLE